jgi:hypothetical protein
MFFPSIPITPCLINACCVVSLRGSAGGDASVSLLTGAWHGGTRPRHPPAHAQHSALQRSGRAHDVRASATTARNAERPRDSAGAVLHSGDYAVRYERTAGRACSAAWNARPGAHNHPIMCAAPTHEVRQAARQARGPGRPAGGTRCADTPRRARDAGHTVHSDGGFGNASHVSAAVVCRCCVCVAQHNRTQETTLKIQFNTIIFREP